MSKGSGGTRAANSRSAHGGGANPGKGKSYELGLSKSTVEALEEAKAIWGKRDFSDSERMALRRAQVRAMSEMLSSLETAGKYEIARSFFRPDNDVPYGVFAIGAPDPRAYGGKANVATINTTMSTVDVPWSNMKQSTPGFEIIENNFSNWTFVTSPKELHSYLKKKGYIK